ncbi:alpha/beta fold hydrolase [Oculatella sp. LEGE 06141]|uniref:alpha/beta hydrolase n=1 Tax=Oculatella sp. LEGE 06141 TaxID=1828648 RepID=UPI0018801419|nr:alpha/beta hydrolase [Oculatella sp. LEGE 06141]MBE9179847.1 alpha/beta fold hydrolase [Oculatella sp. LEGE 06141]
MVRYSELTASLINRIKVQEDALPLQNDGCRSRFLFKSAPTSKVCLFFHGFTAGPYQFDPIGKALFQAGYNVLVPRMPGHGQAGEWGRNNPPPLPEQAEIYQKFALQWLQVAQALGTKVVVGGLSGGGTLATWLAFQRPQQIDRTLAFAPYLSSSNKVIDLFVRNFNTYFEWVSADPNPKGKLGYGGFMVPALRVFLQMGKEILNQAARSPVAPLFIVSSESDMAVGNRDHRILFETALKHQPKCWYHRFDQVLDIPHTMMTQVEGNQYENLLITMSKAYIESDLTWAEVEEIGYRMTRGKTFNTAVSELNLGQRVSRDMPAMMTMVDKRSIVIARSNRSSRF